MSENPLNPNTVIFVLKVKLLETSTIEMSIVIYIFGLFCFLDEMLAFLYHIYLNYPLYTYLNLLFRRC